MTKTMAEVLAEHTFAAEDTCACTCDEMFYDWRRTPEQVQVEHRLHIEERLSAAGFGLVADAKAEALEEAAVNILTNDPLDYWDGHLPEGLGFQQAMSSWLKAHAAVFKGGTP